MPLPFAILMSVLGVLYVLFAFVDPPNAVRGFFKVPSILVFLPDRWVMPVGRFLVGAGLLVMVVMLWIKTHP